MARGPSLVALPTRCQGRVAGVTRLVAANQGARGRHERARHQHGLEVEEARRRDEGRRLEVDLAALPLSSWLALIMICRRIS
jgi:hypothetical protein